MRIYIILCLICWSRSGYFSFSLKPKPVSRKTLENKRPCLKFSKLSVKDSFIDLFNPKVEMYLIMYTRSNPDCAEPLFQKNKSLNVNFYVNKKTTWLIHGYRPTGSPPAWLQDFVRILLNQNDMNIIVVDWNRGATTLIYSRAVKNTRRVAAKLTESIQLLLKHGASLDNFHFIGMSLGAHVSGFVGKIFKGQLGRITGLDPAGPQFSGNPPNDRLDYTDAKFVDVIHSDTSGLGIKEPVGHIDFYPNGGKEQPGCPKSVFAGVKFIKCNHQRAIYLFMAALETKCNFVSFPCHSYEDYKTGSCVDCDDLKKNPCPKLGYQAELWKDVLIDKRRRSRRTTVFLDTADRNPFCRDGTQFLGKFTESQNFLCSPDNIDYRAYYFVLSIVVLDSTMKDGYITLKLLNQLGVLEEPTLFEQNKSFYRLKEVKILAQFLNDVNISSIGLAFYQNAYKQCSTCKYRIQRFMLKSLTYPERPPLCKYDFMLKESQEVFFNPCACKPEEM